jgi:hypothetical protein
MIISEILPFLKNHENVLTFPNIFKKFALPASASVTTRALKIVTTNHIRPGITIMIKLAIFTLKADIASEIATKWSATIV